MKKMMFLALALSVMAMGSVSAAESDRSPVGLKIGIGGNKGHVMVSVGDKTRPPKGCGDYRDYRDHKDRDCRDPRHNKKGHNHNGNKRYAPPRGKAPGHCPVCHKPGRPVPPPPPAPRRW